MSVERLAQAYARCFGPLRNLTKPHITESHEKHTQPRENVKLFIFPHNSPPKMQIITVTQSGGVTSSKVVWLQYLLRELGVFLISHIPLYASDTSIIQSATNPIFHQHNILKLTATSFTSMFHLGLPSSSCMLSTIVG